MDNKTTDFELWPAIDLVEGAPARLIKGDFTQKKRYDVSIESLIREFETFASGIHIIDLDGARFGRVMNEKAVRSAIESASLPIQLGGGIRDFEAVERWLLAGVDRVIMGTKALTDPDLLKRCADNFGADRFVISVDVKNGKLMTKGWTESSDVDAFEFMENKMNQGFRRFMATDIEQDGTLKGPSEKLYSQLKARFPEVYLLAAGGVAGVEDLRKLKETGCDGAIFGKAFYEGRLSVEELNHFILSN